MSIEDRICSLERKIRDLKSELEDAKREEARSFCDTKNVAKTCYTSKSTYNFVQSSGKVTMKGLSVSCKETYGSFGEKINHTEVRTGFDNIEFDNITIMEKDGINVIAGIGNRHRQILPQKVNVLPAEMTQEPLPNT